MSQLPPNPSRDSLDSSATPTALSPRPESPFTNHEWQHRPSSSRYQPRRGSTASSISSIGGTLDISGHTRLGTVRDTGQNAISTLLQPPIVRTGLLPHTSAPASSTHRPPSTRDIPPVTLTNIPQVGLSVFKPYLSQVGSLYESRARAEEGEEPSSQWSRRDKASSREDYFGEVLDRKLRVEQQRPHPSSRQGSTSTLSPIESPQMRRGSSGGVSRRALAVTPLSTIPPVYFEENFHLENPRTFDIVSERSEVVRTPISPTDESKGANGFGNGIAAAPRKALATNAILQEKLSWYLDTVEIHLISSISTASKSFFAALGSLKELHSEAADSVTKIKKLRVDLAKLDKDMAMGGLEIVGMKQRRENLRKLNDAVQQLRYVVNGATHCEELVDQGELETALDRIGILEDFTYGRLEGKPAEGISWLCETLPRPLLDLRRLKALDGFAQGMDQFRARIGKGYESRFLEAMLQDLRQHINTVPHSDTLKRWASASQRSRGQGHISGPSAVPAYMHTNSELRQNLSIILNGLSRARYTSPATLVFRDAIMREMKNLIRQQLPSSSDDDATSITSISTTNSRTLSQSDKSAILARNLRYLGGDDAEALLMKMFCGVGESLRRLQTQVKMLLDVSSGSVVSPTSSIGSRSPPKSPNMGSIDASIGRARSNSTPLQEELMQALDLSSLLGQAVDASQTQITKILKVRTEQSSQLSLQQFLRYFTLNRLFADECEAVSGRSGAALKGVVNSHITDFIAVMAKTERNQMAQIMEADKWESKDFTTADSELLSLVLEGMTSDPKPWLAQTNIWEEPGAPLTNGNLPAEINGTTNGTSKEKNRSALIEDEKFVLAESAISLLHTIARFQTLIACIPSISTEVSKELVDILRLFNSLSCQLILGAGATRSSASLTHINTKHLALASQALSFVITLTPYIREFVRRRPGMTTEKLAEYDKTKRLYQDHQVSINEKLVEIMSMRATAHVNAMKKIDFDEDSRKEKEGATNISKHMETLTKETTSLHRVLSRYLPEINVKIIMGPVFANYREQWGEAFRGAGVKTEVGKARLLRDAEHFDAKLCKIDGSGDLGDFIVNIVKEKTVATAKAPSPPPRPPPPQTLPQETMPPAAAGTRTSMEKPKPDVPETPLTNEAAV
ncbi:Vps54-domain-containing protein [Tothia fuscella]|uniref:Vps54-domain-containing protein n=1 Tax=Tothia fuscella TaxID=1048955 RepID=A0A9P4P3Z3_9PEZI|nr:Vps54-domain-containing protein [Tothia fuscella]